MSRRPVFRLCGTGHSLFQFIDDVWEDQQTSNDRAVHRLCSLMRKAGAETVVAERLEPSDDAEVDQEERALSLHLKRGVKFTKVFRLTFLSCPIKNNDELESTDEENFLAHAIIVNVRWTEKRKTRRRSYLLRSIITVPTIECSPRAECADWPKRLPLLNTYLHIHRRFDCVVGLGNGSSRTYSILGTYFCQQNGFTSVCAHAALKMVANNFPKPSPDAARLHTTEDINQMLSIDHMTRRLVGGLNRAQVETVLRHLGYNTIQQDFFRDPTLDYAGYIHHLIESSCPCLLLFTTNDPRITHVVPVFGHTLNSDMWRPEAELAYSLEPPSRFAPYPNYRPATMWIDNFIIHDDNFGMYLSLPVDSLRRTTIPDRDPTFRAILVIGVVPYELSTTSSEAEGASEWFVRNLLRVLQSVPGKGYWMETLCREKRAPLVIRTALFTRERYRNHLGYKTKEKKADSYNKVFDDGEIMRITRNLPKYFWLSELSFPDLYTANKSKLIDVVYSATRPSAITEADMAKKLIMIRLPGFALRFKQGSVSDVVRTDVLGHYPLFRVSKEVGLFEW